MSIGAHSGDAKPVRVCFVVPGFYPLLNPSAPGLIGGSETRALTFARGLARLDRYDVSATAFDYGQPEVERYDGMTVYRDDCYSFRSQDGDARPVLQNLVRTVGQRLRLPWGTESTVAREADVWRAARADVYCAFGVADYSAGLAAWCRTMGRSLVLFTGSDLDVSETYRPDSKAINDCGSRADRCYEALAHAHTIVVQTRTQAKLLAERFGRQGVVISNPIDFMEGVAGTGARTRRFILWVGKSDAIKRPESAIELARMCPNVPFTMVMNRADPAVFAQIHAACPPNLEMIERVAPRQMASLYEGAVALLNTSRVEGFPNAFLEAGKHGAPVVSLTVDPDGIIARHDAGMVAGGDLNRLAEAVRKFHADPDTARRCGANLRAYVRRHHSLSDSLARLDALFRRLTVERTVPPCAALPAS